VGEDLVAGETVSAQARFVLVDGRDYCTLKWLYGEKATPKSVREAREHRMQGAIEFTKAIARSFLGRSFTDEERPGDDVSADFELVGRPVGLDWVASVTIQGQRGRDAPEFRLIKPSEFADIDLRQVLFLRDSLEA
jgi:hypothetical protein